MTRQIAATFKQEHRFVAERYRFLAPFVDSQLNDVYLSLDGQAALQGRDQGFFEDQHVPDLWFTLIGQSKPTLIEAKILRSDGKVNIGRGQLSHWEKVG